MSDSAYPHLFAPLRAGRLQLRNRIMLPPHGRMIGDLFGAPEEAKRVTAYWVSRARDGAGWVTGINGFIDNTIVPKGFRPTGVGAVLRGNFRLPQFVERASRFAAAVKAEGALVTAQIIHQGGMPHSPSGRLANHLNNQVPHAMQPWEIEWFVGEYAHAAKQLSEAGLDGVELHANHEDLLQLFLSPATNHRDDAWGGDRERRLKFLKDVIAAVRREARPGLLVGLRFNMDELFEGGYDLEEGIAIARSLEATGALDWFSGVIGNNWGSPSYIQTHDYGPAQWAPLAGRFRAALQLPVVYGGRIDDPDIAERVLAAGQADVVAVARPMFADEHWTSKARSGRADTLRPCIGCNDCLHAQLVDGTPFGCSVNPAAGRESEPPAPVTDRPRSLVVVGAGPAGLELAIRAAERGHRVRLWERETQLGGQLRLAAQTRENTAMVRYLDHQALRLRELGVEVELGTTATIERVLAAQPDVVAIATGASPRPLEVPGADGPQVLQGWDVLAGRTTPGPRVALVAMEDHMQPLVIASWLLERGHAVELVYATPGVAPLLGKYSIGGVLGGLAASGARFRVMERVTAVEPGRLHTANVFSGTPGEVSGFDSVVLACGGRSEAALYAPLRERIPETHLLGDAYAPRRLWYATRQGYSLALSL